MKKHISITIDDQILQVLKKIAKANHSSLSRILELAAADYTHQRLKDTNPIPTSKAYFNGTFSREDTYDR
jgi:predicted transcriptional regulator